MAFPLKIEGRVTESNKPNRFQWDVPDPHPHLMRLGLFDTSIAVGYEFGGLILVFASNNAMACSKVRSPVTSYPAYLSVTRYHFPKGFVVQLGVGRYEPAWDRDGNHGLVHILLHMPREGEILVLDNS